MKNDQKGFGAVEGLLILVVLAVIAGGGYFLYQSNNKDEQSQKTDLTQNATNQQTPADKSEATKKSIDAALDAGNYRSLETYMEETVSYARQGSDAAKENTAKAEATQQFVFFGPSPSGNGAKTPWDFRVMETDSEFAASIKAANNPAYNNAYIGRSGDKGSFIAFKFSEKGLISSFWYGATTAL